MPSHPPGQPPNNPRQTSEDSGTRHRLWDDFHLSNPKTRKLTALKPANQASANLSVPLSVTDWSLPQSHREKKWLPESLGEGTEILIIHTQTQRREVAR